MFRRIHPKFYRQFIFSVVSTINCLFFLRSVNCCPKVAFPLFPERDRCRCSNSSQLQTLLSTCSALILQYELRLTASDNLKENYTTVVIHVKDVNDNPPVFERPTYKTQITEEDDRTLPKRVLGVIIPSILKLVHNLPSDSYSLYNWILYFEGRRTDTSDKYYNEFFDIRYRIYDSLI